MSRWSIYIDREKEQDRSSYASVYLLLFEKAKEENLSVDHVIFECRGENTRDEFARGPRERLYILYIINTESPGRRRRENFLAIESLSLSLRALSPESA